MNGGDPTEGASRKQRPQDFNVVYQRLFSFWGFQRDFEISEVI